MNDTLHALITLQKQSNNYKKLLYLFIPVIIAVLLCMFGFSFLAVKLNKDAYVKGNVLQSTTGDAVRTATELKFHDLYQFAFEASMEEMAYKNKIILGNQLFQFDYVNQEASVVTFYGSQMYIQVFVNHTLSAVSYNLFASEPSVKTLVERLNEHYSSKLVGVGEIQIVRLSGN